ncbi:DUF3515 family protein [Rothia sp. ZJ932]|nr:DUF3515 family protein [Rothia sp. ZJ1223]MBM7050936.1 DUF3515 family protein [Rothia sp. ZJ1223]QRZ62570.1 DUF3515 family protein [Rothia sp. ZJ932]
MFPLTGVTALCLVACSSPVNLTAAPDAAHPDCAKAMVAMPQELMGFTQRETTAQATTAWGDPAAIIVKCGVNIEQPVTDPCAEVNGVDWILNPLKESEPQDTSVPADAGVSETLRSSEQTATGTWTATTFGRAPAITVTFNADEVASSTLLTSLNSAVAQIEQTQQCLSADDVTGS